MRNRVPERILNVRLFRRTNALGTEEQAMAEEKKGGVDRRSFLKTAAAGVGVSAAPVLAAAAEGGAKEATHKGREKMIPGDIVVERPGSDFMADVIKSLDLEYAAINPASSFRSLHESLVNYGGNVKPELITCTHEEAAVAIAHGYAKAAGKPMAAIVHGSGRLQE